MASTQPKTYQRLQQLLDSLGDEGWTAMRAQIVDGAARPLFEAQSSKPLETLRLASLGAQAPQIVRCVRLLLANRNQAARKVHEQLLFTSLPAGSWWHPKADEALIAPRLAGATGGQFLNLADKEAEQLLLVALWCAPALAGEWEEVLKAKRFLEAAAQMALSLR